MVKHKEFYEYIMSQIRSYLDGSITKEEFYNTCEPYYTKHAASYHKFVWYSNFALPYAGGDEFENDVNSYGTQTYFRKFRTQFRFENDVNSYGTQTEESGQTEHRMFENDVNSYGTQTR